MRHQIRIDDWELDDDNLSEMAVHHITAAIFLQVADGEPRYRRNKKGRAAQVQMIGPDDGGRYWLICIARTQRAGVWRPVTGWIAKPGDITWYKRSK